MALDASVRPAMTRRTLLALPFAAATAAACRRSGPPFAASDFRLPGRSAVGLFPASDYAADLVSVISRGLAALEVDVRGRSVLLKPNLVEYEAGHAINTHPLVVVSAAVALRSAGAREVVVAEGPGHRRDVEYLLTSTGLFGHLREIGVSFVDLNHDDVREVPTRSWFTGLRSIALPAAVLAADLVVSMPKLKTHHWAGITCSMKNFFGVVPGAVYGWPKNLLHVRGIDASILDLVATVRPGLTIVDGIVGMEGDGPIMGRARPVGFLAMGTDLAAVDATCARVIGLDPEKVVYLDAAGHFLGNIDEGKIEQRGENPSRYRADFDLIDSWTAKRLRG
jgi:uncharacterized protein (DUF362 family)